MDADTSVDVRVRCGVAALASCVIFCIGRKITLISSLRIAKSYRAIVTLYASAMVTEEWGPSRKKFPNLYLATLLGLNLTPCKTQRGERPLKVRDASFAHMYPHMYHRASMHCKTLCC